ncbi:hypothetical protein [Daejeonella oryzae]|uniref:hypothetical protein n=1 Tax=Daejeonella oryzae TaxID=1122943 RepID=UPI00041540D7|nr:hypothetical protein [Daejeonella oryzae]
MKKVKILSILNSIVFIIAFLISNLSQFKYFGTQNIGEVSDKYQTLFAPAGFTFGIWGLIYLSLFAFNFYHLNKAFTASEKNEFNEYTRSIDIYFIINNIAASAWVFAWINEQLGLSVILMLVQLITLLLINIRLHIYNPHTNWSVKIVTQMPFSIYFGWICVATIANISAFLVSVNWDGAGISDSYWLIILIGLSVLLTLFLVFVRRNLFFAMVIMWALYGIMDKNTSTQPEFYQNINQAIITAMAVIALSIIIQSVNNIKLARINAKTPYIS